MEWARWEGETVVEPSLYAADFMRLGEQIEALLAAGCRVFHFDVGDGHFVPPVTIGPVVLRSVAPLIHALDGRIDCHLMVTNPGQVPSVVDFAIRNALSKRTVAHLTFPNDIRVASIEGLVLEEQTPLYEQINQDIAELNLSASEVTVLAQTRNAYWELAYRLGVVWVTIEPSESLTSWTVCGGWSIAGTIQPASL